MNDFLELSSDYHIFSAFFEKSESSSEIELSAEEVESSSELSSDKEGTKIGKKYESYHKILNNTENVRLKNVRPLSFIPVISESDDGEREIWATDYNYRLCSLSHGSQISESKSISILNHTSPVHHLAKSHYKLTFPPIDMLMRLAQGNKTYEKLCKEIKGISDKVSSESIEFAVTEIHPSQLAPAYAKDDQGNLTDEKEKYNSWRERVLKEKKNIKGFLVPSVATCVVVFSNREYLNAIVSLQKYDKNGNELLKGKLVSPVRFPDENNNVDHNDKPCANFHLDPELFDDGYYSIRVVFDEIEMPNGRIPEFISKANISFVGDEVNKKYQYELREYIKVIDNNPLGKFAIVCGDMISLEESLIYQFPQYMGRMKKYLSGQYDLEGISSPAMKSLMTLKSVAVTTSQIAGGYASGTWSQMIQKEGELKTFNTVSKLVWQNINTELPEAMKATGELYYGLFAVADAKAQFDLYFKETDAMKRKIGLKSFLSEKFLDVAEFKKYLGSFSHDIRNRHWTVLSGRLSETWSGGTAGWGSRGAGFVETTEAVYKIYDTSSQVIKNKKETTRTKEQLDLIAFNYLKNIPVWRESLSEESTKIDAAILKSKEILSQNTHGGGNVSLLTDERGSGIKVLFNFNARETVLSQNQGIIQVLTDALFFEPRLRIEIEGHACQVGMPEINLKISHERAMNAKDLFPQSLHDSIIVRAFGDAVPLYRPKDESEINRSNPRLKDNRRVEIRIYISSLDVVFNPSRSGSQALERGRLATLASIKKEYDSEVDMILAIFDGLLQVASHMPVIAPAARGILVAKESAGVAKSALTVLDSLLFEHAVNEYWDNFKKLYQLHFLSFINIDLLKEYNSVNVQIDKAHQKYQDMINFLNEDSTKMELLKRYNLRSVALNGLMYILAWVKGKHNTISHQLLEQYDVSGYLETYVMKDDWVLNTIGTTNLGLDWLNAREFTVDDLYNPYDKYNRTMPLPMNILGAFFEDNISAKFNRVFPIQTKLFENGKESLFEEFANNFSVIERTIRKNDIGFCRILVAEPNSDDWKEYDYWRNPYRTNRITPFHKVKAQVILKSNYNEVISAKLGYDRIDGIINVSGPKFEALIVPMKVDSFSSDPYERIKEYYKHRNEETLLGFEFVPFYQFGEAKIHGMKPLTSKTRIAKEIINYPIGFIKKIYYDLVLDQQYEMPVDEFDWYVKSGGFREMQYTLWMKTGAVSIELPPFYSEVNHRMVDFDDFEPELKYGVHGENSSTVTIPTSFGEKAMILREKDLLNESFTLANDTKSKHVVPIVDSIDKYCLGFRTAASGIRVFSNSGKYNKGIWSDESSREHKQSEENPQSFYILFLSQKTNRSFYETSRLDWKKVAMNLQLEIADDSVLDTFVDSVDDNVAVSIGVKAIPPGSATVDAAKVLNDKKTPGPTYKSFAYYQGDYVFNPTSEPSFRAYWEFTNKDKVKGNNSDELDSFIRLALRDKAELDKKSTYAVYAMEVPISYTSPTGLKVKGLRPFGCVLKSDEVKLSVNITQNDLSFSEVFKDFNKINITFPGVKNMTWLKPWVKQQEGYQRDGIDNTAAEQWRALTDHQQDNFVKDWIENQPTVVEAPILLERPEASKRSEYFSTDR
ncbi:OmpA family protein [Photobacterium sp. R1]